MAKSFDSQAHSIPGVMPDWAACGAVLGGSGRTADWGLVRGVCCRGAWGAEAVCTQGSFVFPDKCLMLMKEGAEEPLRGNETSQSFLKGWSRIFQ